MWVLRLIRGRFRLCLRGSRGGSKPRWLWWRLCCRDEHIGIRYRIDTDTA
ncbi:hypothetical protein Hanom_Chr03g00266401 [Helianthus anomalus]